MENKWESKYRIKLKKKYKFMSHFYKVMINFGAFNDISIYLLSH